MNKRHVTELRSLTFSKWGDIYVNWRDGIYGSSVAVSQESKVERHFTTFYKVSDHISHLADVWQVVS